MANEHIRALAEALDEALDEAESRCAPEPGERRYLGDYFADRAEGARSAVTMIRVAIERRLKEP